MSSVGNQTVTASYTENGVTVTATYQITVYKVLTKITLSGQTTSFTKGATFSFGGTVTATYNDGSTANVTSSTTFSGYNMNNVGTQTVTASYTYRSVTKTATYNITVSYATYTLKYYYQGMGNGKGRMRVNYTKANGTTAWGTTTTATTGQSNTITVTAAKGTSVKVQMYNDTSYTASLRVYQFKNGSSSQLTSQSVSANANKTWTSGNLNPGTDNTLTLRVEYH